MSNVFEDIANLDRLIHEPARLALLTILSRMHADDRADFVYLRKMIGLTEGNLSGHITKLEEGGLIHIQKQFVNKRPNTQIRLTETGEKAIARYWRTLEHIIGAIPNASLDASAGKAE
ncbi:MAG TPA: transcriptional regulator [Herpetosiphonaceae bacterium]|nr:transcriptional regulator [Herpetosiphonaceae bacterium]